MDGDHRVRYCEQCGKNVHNLGALTEAEARQLGEAGVCGNFATDADGEPVYADRTIAAPSRAPVLVLALLAACAPYLESEDLGPVEDAVAAPAPGAMPYADDSRQPERPELREAHAHEHEGECEPEAVRLSTGGLILPSNEIVINEEIYFASGSATVSEPSKEVLDEIAAVLGEAPDVRMVLIVGHTDSSEPARSRTRFSARRAQAVRDDLVAAGVDPARLEVHGRGAAQPNAPNTTREGRARNRRVTFEIVDQGPHPG